MTSHTFICEVCSKDQPCILTVVVGISGNLSFPTICPVLDEYVPKWRVL